MLVGRHPEAAAELEKSALWYEERESGLGEAFLKECRPQFGKFPPARSVREKMDSDEEQDWGRVLKSSRR